MVGTNEGCRYRRGARVGTMTLSEQAIKYDTRNWSRGMDALYTARMIPQCDRFGDLILAFSARAGRLNRYVLELTRLFIQALKA